MTHWCRVTLACSSSETLFPHAPVRALGIAVAVPWTWVLSLTPEPVQGSHLIRSQHRQTLNLVCHFQDNNHSRGMGGGAVVEGVTGMSKAWA